MSEGPEHVRILGSLREENGAGVVHVEDVYDTDIRDLWSALTDPARLARWLGEFDGDLQVGGEFNARFVSGGECLCRVDVCEAPRHVRVTISAAKPEQVPSSIEATLAEEAGGTRLVIEQDGLPLDTYLYHGSGWQTHIEDLAAYLAGRPVSDWGTRARELTPAYEAMLGR